MGDRWQNWSGSLQFEPGEVLRPRNEDELATAVGRAASDGRRVRVVGSGHSSVPLVETRDVFISLERMPTGVIDHDTDEGTAFLHAATELKEAGRGLAEVGLAFHNYGDVATQTVAGAFGTGTHGSGKRLPDLAAALIGARMVTAGGDVIEWDEESHPDEVIAAQVSLGALGIFTTLRLRLEPAYSLERREYCMSTDDCLGQIDELLDEHPSVDFYWYPRRDEVKVRVLSEPGAEPRAPARSRLVKQESGESWEVIPRVRTLRFDEMEYAVPYADGIDCFQEVRQRILHEHREYVGWRVLYRAVASDDAWLSNAHGRDVVTISLHQNAGLEFWRLFEDIEPIFLAYEGRPHWGKKHRLGAGRLQRLYPRWADFQALRKRVDPDGVFLNDYLRAVLVEEGSAEDAAAQVVRAHEVPPHLPFGRPGA